MFERIAAQRDLRNYWLYKICAGLYAAQNDVPSSLFLDCRADAIGECSGKWASLITKFPDGRFGFVETAGVAGPCADVEVGHILQSPNPNDTLFDFVKRMHQENPTLCIDVFEKVSAFVPVIHYWALYNIARAYRAIGQARAAFVIAAIAEQIEPQSLSWHLYQIMYQYYDSNGWKFEADNIALKQFHKNPENPVADKERLSRLLGQVDGSVSNADGLLQPRLIVETLPFEMAPISTVGPMPLALQKWEPVIYRNAVRVFTIDNATVIIQDNAVLVCDADGNLLPRFCIATLPAALYEVYTRRRSEGFKMLEISVENAGIIKDHFSSKNLCHLILDYMTRIELFKDAGLEAGDTAFITDPLSEKFMQEVAKVFDVKNVISTDQPACVSVKKLWLSDNCTTSFQHPAQLAAPWAIDRIRRRFFERMPFTNEKPLRVYISRAHAGSRRVTNERVVIDTLMAVGFSVIAAEHLSVAEQVSLFRRASHVVSAHGAGLTNIVFCSSGAQILELFHPVGNNPTYAVLSSGCSLSYTALAGTDADSSDPVWNDPQMPERDRLHLGGRGEMNGRNINVPLDRLLEWLDQVGLLARTSGTNIV